MLSTLLLFALSKPWQAHHKETFLISKLPVFSFKNTASLGLPFLSYMYLINFIKLPYGGPGGSRTRVQNTFLFASYSNITHRVSKNRHPLNPLQTYSNHRCIVYKSNSHARLISISPVVYYSTLTSSFPNNRAICLLNFSPRCAGFCW